MPSLNFSDAPPWLQWLLAVAAVVLFAAGVIRGVPPIWRFVSRFVNTVNSLSDLPEQLADQKDFRKQTTDTLLAQDVALKAIKYQVLPNGGSSMRDDVNAIKTHLAVTDYRIDGLEKKNEEGDKP